MFLFLLLGSLASPWAYWKAAAKQPPKTAQAAGIHKAHHLTHLTVFIDHFVDLLNTGAAAAGDAPAPRSIENLGVDSFDRGHRVDDSLGLLELVLHLDHLLRCDLHAAEHARGQHVDNLVERT